MTCKLTSIALRRRVDGILAAVQSINKETATCEGISFAWTFSNKSVSAAVVLTLSKASMNNFLKY